MADTNSKPWYARMEFWGSLIMPASGILMLFSPNTIAYKVGAGLGFLAGSGLFGAGSKKGYQSDNLPGGLTKVMDMIPDSITGVKGEKIK